MNLNKTIQHLTLTVSALALICASPFANAETTTANKKPVAKKKADTPKKAPAKRAVAKKAPTKRAAAKKAVAKKAPAKRAVAKKAPTKRAVAKKAVARKAPPAPRLSRVQLLFKKTDVDYNKALSMQISSKDLATQKKQFAAKQAVFASVSKKLLALTKIKDKGVAVCSLYRLGIANAEMAESVNESPLPNRKGKKWSKAEAKAYRANLKKTVGDKFIAQAKAYYKKAVDLAKKAKIKNHCVQNAILAAKH